MQLVKTTAPVRLVAMSAPAQVAAVDPQRSLDAIVAGAAGTRRAVLASVDGFTVASAGDGLVDSSMAAMTSAAAGLARQLVVAADGARLRQLVIDHDNGLLFVWPIGERHVLAVVAEPGVDQRVLRRLVRAHRGGLLGAGR